MLLTLLGRASLTRSSVVNAASSLPCRVDVHLVPALANEEILGFLRQLQVEWPSLKENSPKPEDVLALKEALRRCPHAMFAETEQGGVVCKLHLKDFLEKQEGYDLNLDVFLGKGIYHFKPAICLPDTEQYLSSESSVL